MEVDKRGQDESLLPLLPGMSQECVFIEMDASVLTCCLHFAIRRDPGLITITVAAVPPVAEFVVGRSAAALNQVPLVERPAAVVVQGRGDLGAHRRSV